MARSYNDPVDYSGRPRNRLTAEEQRAKDAAMQRWQDSQSQPISDRKAASEPSNVKYDHHVTDDDSD